MKKGFQKKAAAFIAMMSMLATLANPALAHDGHEGDSHPIDLGDAPLSNDQVGSGGEEADYDVPASEEDLPAGDGKSAATTQGGPIILMGIDAEDGGPNVHGSITVYQTIVRNILKQVTNGNSGILVLGGGKSSTDHVTKFWNEIGKGTGQKITYLNGATNLANKPFLGYAMIGVASDVINTPSGGLTQAENNALAMRQPNIAQFVNDGGALLGFSSRFSNPYVYMGGLGSFRVRVGMDYSNIDPTADGLAIGVTNSLDVSAWHDVYLSFPSFLKVLARDHGTRYAAAIGGADVKVVPVDEPPVVTATPDRAPNSNGWYKADVTVTFTATDEDMTPVRYVDPPRVVSNEGKDMEIIGMAQDTAGYKGWGSVKISIDKTAPSVKADLLSEAPDAGNGSYPADVKVSFTGTDNLSGIDAIEYSVNGGAWTRANGEVTITESGEHRIEYRAIDKAGNAGTTETSSFTISKESFEVTPTFDQAPNSNGWYNGPVTVALNPVTSGVRMEYQIGNGDWITYTGPFVVDASSNIKFRVIGSNGAVGPIQECNLQIDRSAPSVTPVLNPASPNGSNGWYTTSPSIELIGRDDLSGLDKVEYRIGDGPWIDYTGGFNLPHDCTCKIEYRFTDKAGNSGSGQFDFNLDTTAPTTSVTIAPPDGENGWYVTAPTLVLTGQDGGSGVGTIEYRIGNGDWITYTGPTLLPGKCTCKITYRTTDNAGNHSPEQSIDVKIDTEAPTTTATVNPAGPNGQNGWYTSEVTITLEGNDDTSGCSKTQCRIVPKDGEPGEWFDYTGPIVVRDGGEYTIEYRTVDNAGNVEETQRLPIQLDNTAPQTECKLSPAPNDAGWYSSPVTVTLPATDNGSGVDKTEYRVIDGDQAGEWTEYTGPFELPKNCSCRIEYRSDDRAGNTEPTQTVPVQVDTTAPTLTITLENQILWPPNHKYVPIRLKVEATDNLSGIEKIELVSIKSNESDEWLGDGHHTDDIIEAEVGTFDTEFRVRSERSGLLSGRTYTATYKATDKAGNVTIASYTITVPHDMRDKNK